MTASGYALIAPTRSNVLDANIELDKNMPNVPIKDWQQKLHVVANQTKQLMDKNGSFVRCGCLRKLKPHQAYKCLYCEEAFCKTCAEIHFGKTIAEYRTENPICIPLDQIRQNQR